MNLRIKPYLYILISALLLALWLVMPATGEDNADFSASEVSVAEAVDSEEPISEIESPDVPFLRISPVNARLSLEAGKSVENSFTITNTGSSPFSVRVYSSPYTNGNADYDNDFETETKYTQISHWISFLDSEGEVIDRPVYTLDSGQTIEVKYRIDVPEDVPSGGQYACIFTEALNNDDTAGIKTVTRAGLIVFGNIAGETRRQSKIGDVNINSELFKGNVVVTTNVENTGNIDFQTSVDISIQSVFGKELYSDRQIYTVLPETTRNIISEWNETPFYGLFRLRTTVTALGTEMESERYILVMPPIMIAFTIVLIAGITISLTVYLKHKKYDSIELNPVNSN